MSMPSLPPVTILASDYARLGELVKVAHEDQHPVAKFLFSEIQRARILDSTPPQFDNVTLNRWVTYRVDWGPAESRILVHPQDYVAPKRQLSVLSPEGAALIGLKVGDRMPYRSIDGWLHVVTVESLDPPITIVPFTRDARARPDPQNDSFDPGPDAA